MDISFDDPELDFCAIMLGDDNLTCAHIRFQDFVKKGGYVAALLELGFKSKLTIRESIWHSEFCSQRFWQQKDDVTEPGAWTLGVKPTRWLERHATTIGPISDIQREQNMRGAVITGYCQASTIPIVRAVCDKYVEILEDQQLTNWVKVCKDKRWNAEELNRQLRMYTNDPDVVYRKQANTYGDVPKCAKLQFQTIYGLEYEDVEKAILKKMENHRKTIALHKGVAIYHPLI